MTARLSCPPGLPAIPASDLQGAGDIQRIIFSSENDDFRANVGCVNGNTSDVSIEIDMYSNDGEMLETKTLNLGPWSNGQITRIFRDYAPLNGYVDVFSNTEGAAFYWPHDPYNPYDVEKHKSARSAYVSLLNLDRI